MKTIAKILFSVLVLGVLVFVVNYLEANWRPKPNQERALASWPVVAAQSEVRATFGVVGDIMLSRSVAVKINKAKNPLLPFAKLSYWLKNNDFNFGNLESPFSGKDVFLNSPSMVFNAPRQNIKGLVENKFQVLSIANNHALDQGIKGLNYTIKYLKDNNLQPTGAGANLTEAWQPAVITANGIRIAFISTSYSSINDNGKSRNQYVARIEDIDKLRSAIARAREQADWVVVSMHAGTEYKYKPNQAQVAFAHAAIDTGADLVVGAHPHWVQTIEKYNGKYIFYSLGNFIFDQEWSRETKEGLILKVELAQGGENEEMATKLFQIEIIPIIVENYSTPRLANDKEAKKILDRIGQKERVIK